MYSPVLVVFVFFNVEHVVVRHEPVHRTVFVETARYSAAGVHFVRGIEAMIILVVAIRELVELFEVAYVHSALLASAIVSVSAVEGSTHSSDGAGVPFIHLRVSSGDTSVLGYHFLRAWLY